MLGKVLANNVLVVLHIEQAVDKKTRSGIIIPSGIDEENLKNMKLFKEHPLQGDVVQIGPDVTICKEGDRVYLSRIGAELIENSTYYQVVNAYDILYVITKEDWEKKQKESVTDSEITS